MVPHPCGVFRRDEEALGSVTAIFLRTVRLDPQSLIHHSVCEIQADAFVRRHPDMRVASMRFHFVAPMEGISAAKMHEYMGAWKDLWGWVSADATADACLKGLTAPTSTFAIGHETFFIVAGTHCQQGDSMTLLKSKFPEITDIRKPLHGNDGFFDTSKAKRMLGWEEEGFPWRP